MKLSLKGPGIIVLMACVIAGCDTGLVRDVNEAALALRVSNTDDASRARALHSRGLIALRSEDYRVGPEDLLEVSIFEWELREETKTAAFRVAESGIISLPVIGDVKVGGKTLGEVKKLIEQRLQEGGFIKSPQVSVDISEYRSKRIAVVGAVNDPGTYTLRQNVTTLLDIMNLAGGVSERAGTLLYVISSNSPPGGKTDEDAPDVNVEEKDASYVDDVSKRKPGERAIVTIDLYELLEQGDLTLDMVLSDGDVVHVPEAAKFSVVGHVREPGSFPIKRPTNVLDAIAMAGGLEEKEASPRKCILKRVETDGEVIIPLDFVAIARGKAPNLYLSPNDIIVVRQTAGKKAAIELLDALKYIFNVGYTVNR